MSTIKLPGLIDPHVHLREPGALQKEDFKTGTKAAVAGGYTTILDMPNNPVATISPEALDDKIARAANRIYCDVGFHFGGSKDSVAYFDQVLDKVFALKVYMNYTTGKLLIEDQETLELIFERWPKTRPIIVHAEGSRLSVAIDLAKRYGKRLHVAHVSLAEEIEQIKKAKDEGLLITCEVTCHHLFLTADDAKSLGPYGIMKPPLGSKADQEALWRHLDVIDCIASDHAPHTKEEKEQTNPVPFGVPGLETSLPLLLTAVADGRLSVEKLIALTSTNPAKIFGIIQSNQMYTEVDMHEAYTISNKNLFTKCGWSPFEGMQVKGRVKKVVIRGKTVFDDGIVYGPYGKVVVPSP